MGTMFEKKYNITQEENLFWAKRNLADYIWKSANLEGIKITYPEVQTILAGVSVQGKRIIDINTIIELKHGWLQLFATIDDELNLKYIQKIHHIIGRMTIINSGSLRLDDVKIAGSSYIPPLPNSNTVNQIIFQILENNCEWTEKALDLMLYLTKSQLFYDGNKRIAMLIANKLLIQHGCGVLSVSQKHLEKFFTLLVAYYEDDAQEMSLKEFLYDYCLDGFKNQKGRF